MIRKIAALGLLVGLLLLGAPPPAEAQWLVVDACPPTRATPYPTGVLAPLTIDKNGVLCTSGIGAIGSGGVIRGLITCDNHVFKHITSATDTLAVQGVAAQTIYVCGWKARAAGVATWYFENTASVNANCSSTLTQITGLATEAANTGEVVMSPFWNGLKNTAGNGLCINSTGTGGVDIDVWFTQF